MICKQCGKEIPENSNFCTFCGAAQPVTEPVQEQAPQPEAPAPAAEPELVVEPGPAPEAPPAPELVFDLPVPEPEAAPAPKAEEPAPMPLPDPAPMPLPDPVADPAPKEEGPAPVPLPDPVPTPGNGPANGPVGGPPPVPPTPAQPAGAAPANGGVSYDLVLKIFAAICGVVCVLRALGSIGGVFGSLVTLVRYADIPSLFYMVLNLGSLVCYLAAAAMLALLALRRTKENTEALVFGLTASAAGLLIVRLLTLVLSILLNIIFYQFFTFRMFLNALGSLVGLAFWLAVCLGGVWGILYLMKEAPQPASVINDPSAKLTIITEALKKGAGEVQQQAGAAAASAKSAYDAHQAQQQAQAAQYQAQAQAAGYPAVRIQTNRSLIAYILLSIITCGIYGYYFIYSIARDVNTMCRDDGEKTGGLLAFILLSFVTCGFYGLYWEYKLGNRLAANAPRYGITFQENGTSVLLWYLVGSLLCGIGPFIAMHILIKNTNALAAAYNAHNGL
ncbi:DUF4234 domain-containing protein [Candidatus Allofournierella merdipullorum]|uniref:DUF4234 domain-containing protein n=1 Tax=Candidatus Allofournierella merdipullorum TaxID=2838595 RepID=UPI003AB3FB5B